ncbi:4Fe-4S binding domain-containing protein [Geosporobacter subterraneus DSM 17957]|uniref:4Fe-4S binding domain-containing protein n=1 Tax=Geosporobacter subterraneus DSM 17957 TaxID=1121919 RepID=A0A1M6NQW0_9FIRM|nr:4Fe-4S binding protein [Geosporobacter subterraneus]SHJ98117.1 4Fe-4S binding domain-containing protein [Geosporobacter subterraneus DSM 17957]
MALRKIVHIDEDKCNGCGVCVPSCAEGAIKIIDGKAKLIADNLCDGLGACLGDCPQDAIKIIERDAAEFDEEAVKEHLSKENTLKLHQVHEHPNHGGHGHGGCPGSRLRSFNQEKKADTMEVSQGDIEIKIKSQLTQWPVQLMLVPPTAPYFQGADLLVTADCVPFAYPNYHLELLKGKKVVIGCPKLDDVAFYAEKLTQILKMNDIKSVTVAFMEVPCCTGIVKAVEKAIADAGMDIPVYRVRIGIEGAATKL